MLLNKKGEYDDGKSPDYVGGGHRGQFVDLGRFERLLRQGFYASKKNEENERRLRPRVENEKADEGLYGKTRYSPSKSSSMIQAS